ncbi:MAG: sulfatase, partial [Bacteroidales bacterium]|nr:sulfatase [Bacteroidales bacterium]
MIKSIYTLIISGFILLATYSCSSSKKDQNPNILWIYVEDISSDFNCYGNTLVKSPNIDKLAENGVLFRNTFMPAPVCSPCRSAIITGAMPTTFGTHNHHSSRTDESAIHLPDYVKTLPELFREAGYFTFNHGKDDYNFAYDRESLYSGEIKDNGMYGLVGLEIDWNAREEGQPFFGQIQLYGNKHIYNKKFKDKVLRTIGTDSLNIPPYYPDTDFIRQEWANYLESQEITDKEVGDIIQRLKDDGVLENTYIFFFSDHGMRLWRHKQFLYDSGTRVPFILSFFGENGKLKQGTENTDIISGLDIGTTSLGLAGISPPEYTEGIDIFSNNSEKRDYVISVRDRCDYTI